MLLLLYKQSEIHLEKSMIEKLEKKTLDLYLKEGSAFFLYSFQSLTVIDIIHGYHKNRKGWSLFFGQRVFGSLLFNYQGIQELI